MILLCGYAAYLGTRAARSWLADQPAYQLPFKSIVLEPPPPAWYRGGSEAFLEDLRRRAGVPETISLLKLKEKEIRRIFEQSPWTKEVQRTTYRPLGLTVRLIYRTPVALVHVSDDERYLIDELAVILPMADVNPEAGGFDEKSGFLRIQGRGLSGPSDPRPGREWKPKPGAADAAPGNDRIPAAATLARFLQTKLESIDRSHEPALNIRIINPMDREGRGFFLWSSSIVIQWGDAPGEERSGELMPDEKWEILVDWARRGPVQSDPEQDFWKITREGMKRKIVNERPSPESAGIPAPRRDGDTIPAKVSGQSRPSMSP